MHLRRLLPRHLPLPPRPNLLHRDMLHLRQPRLVRLLPHLLIHPITGPGMLPTRGMTESVTVIVSGIVEHRTSGLSLLIGPCHPLGHHRRRTIDNDQSPRLLSRFMRIPMLLPRRDILIPMLKVLPHSNSDTVTPATLGIQGIFVIPATSETLATLVILETSEIFEVLMRR